jgi:integrase
MKGNVYTREKCPICGQAFERDGDDLVCRIHQTRPRRVFIQIYSKELRKAINIHRDSQRRSFESSGEAFRLLTVIRAEIDKNGDFEASRYISEKLKPHLFSNWSEAWLSRKHLEADKGLRAPSYIKTLSIYLKKYQAFFGETDIRDITTKMINDFYLSLSGAPHYIKNILDGLENMLGDAVDWEDIPKIPKFPNVDVPEPDTRTIDLDLQDQVIEAIPDQMDRAFILFTAREMIRPSETRALQWQDVDLKHDRVVICRHFSLNQLRPTTKAKQIKRLPLDGEVKRVLTGLPRHLTSPFVFWKRDGKSFSESWARKLWKRVALTVGVNISLYQGTRHSSATEAVNRVGLDATQEFLGHTSRAMTRRYAKVDVESKKKVLRHG